MGTIKKLRLLNRQGVEVEDIYPISSTLAIYSDDTLQDSSLREKNLNYIIDALTYRIDHSSGGGGGGGSIEGINVDYASMYPTENLNLGRSQNPWKDLYFSGELYSKDENQTTIHTTLQELIEGAAGGSDFAESPFADLTQQDWESKITRPSGGTQGQVLTIGADNTLVWSTVSVPDAQIQSDWSQTNTSSKDYIKNKPSTLSELGISDVSIDTTTNTITIGENSITPITEHQSLSDYQLKNTAVTHPLGEAVGDISTPVYIDSNGQATPITDATTSTTSALSGGSYFRLTADGDIPGYQLCLTRGEYAVPIHSVLTADAETAAVGTGKTYTTAKFDPFGMIFVRNTNTKIASGSLISSTTCRFTGNFQHLNRWFNYTASEWVASKPVYLVAKLESDGYAKIPTDRVAWSQTLPNTNDGYIYILLGNNYSTKNYFYLNYNHPVYYHDGTRLYQYAGDKNGTGGGIVSFSSISGYPEDNTNLNTSLSAKADAATTLAGYGITDASIDTSTNTITLGSNTIVPITQHQDISGKMDTPSGGSAGQVLTKTGTSTYGWSDFSYNSLTEKPTDFKFVPYLSYINGNITTDLLVATIPACSATFYDETIHGPKIVNYASTTITAVAERNTDIWLNADGTITTTDDELLSYVDMPMYQDKVLLARMQTNSTAIIAVLPLANKTRVRYDEGIVKAIPLSFEDTYVIPKRATVKYIPSSGSIEVDKGDVLLDTTNGEYWLVLSDRSTIDSTATFPTVKTDFQYCGFAMVIFAGWVGYEGIWKLSKCGPIVWYFAFIAGGLLAKEYPALVKDLIISGFDHVVYDWQPNTSYKIGQKVAGDSTKGLVWECIKAGTTNNNTQFLYDVNVGHTLISQSSTPSWRAIANWNGVAQYFWKDKEPNGTVRREDSHDSYAAMFLWMINEYIKATGDTSWVTTQRTQLIQNILTYNIINQLDFGPLEFGGTKVFQNDADPDPENPGGAIYANHYLMDNCESYAGLKAAIDIYNTLDISTTIPTETQNVTTTLEAKLADLAYYIDVSYWEDMTGCYLYDTNVTSEDVPTSADYPGFYPWIMAQGAPALWEVPLNYTKQQRAFEWTNNIFPKWWARTDTDTTSSLYAETGFVKFTENEVYRQEVLAKITDYMKQGRGVNIDTYAYYRTLLNLPIKALSDKVYSSSSSEGGGGSSGGGDVLPYPATLSDYNIADAYIDTSNSTIHLGSDSITVVSSQTINNKANPINIVNVTSSTLNSSTGNYYVCNGSSSGVTSLSIYLPAGESNPTILKSVSFAIKAAGTISSNSITFSKSTGTNDKIYKMDGFEITGGYVNEVTAIWTGSMWLLTCVKFLEG